MILVVRTYHFKIIIRIVQRKISIVLQFQFSVDTGSDLLIFRFVSSIDGREIDPRCLGIDDFTRRLLSRAWDSRRSPKFHLDVAFAVRIIERITFGHADVVFISRFSARVAKHQVVNKKFDEGRQEEGVLPIFRSLVLEEAVGKLARIGSSSRCIERSRSVMGRSGNGEERQGFFLPVSSKRLSRHTNFSFSFPQPITRSIVRSIIIIFELIAHGINFEVIRKVRTFWRLFENYVIT